MKTALFVIFALAFTIFFASAAIFLFAGIMAFFFVMWLFGCKIKVTKSDKQIGYIRWFTYYELENSK